MAAGDWRTIIQGAVPVVDNSVGYQPLICVPHVGLAAQVRPTFIPGTETAVLDITSIVTRWDLSRKPALFGGAWPPGEQLVAGPSTTPQAVLSSAKVQATQGGSASCPVDLPVMPTQQIGTTLSVPLGKPVIVGG